MNKPWYKSIRWKLLFTFAFSIVLTLGLLMLLFSVASLMHTDLRIPLVRSLLRFAADNIGVMPSLVLAGLALFILVYFLLNRRLIKNVEKITETVQRIADGNLDAQCHIKSDDELGRLADNINMMTQQLKRSIEEERQAERTKNELVTSVSHDLRTPLTSIIGYLGLVEQDRYRDEVELRHYTNIAYEKAQRLNVMINDLFEYTRMNGGMALRTKPLNVAEIAGQLCVHYRYPMEQAGLSIRMNSQADHYWVEADPDKLVRVFDNLLTNAISYSQPGTLVELNLRRSGNRVAITVNSCGEPIPEQDLPYIFDRFYRVEKSRSEETGGSGLGLAISKTIVELHGGTIAAASDIESTRFTIELPCIAPPTGNG